MKRTELYFKNIGEHTDKLIKALKGEDFKDLKSVLELFDYYTKAVSNLNKIGYNVVEDKRVTNCLYKLYGGEKRLLKPLKHLNNIEHEIDKLINLNCKEQKVRITTALIKGRLLLMIKGLNDLPFIKENFVHSFNSYVENTLEYSNGIKTLIAEMGGDISDNN